MPKLGKSLGEGERGRGSTEKLGGMELRGEKGFHGEAWRYGVTRRKKGGTLLTPCNSIPPSSSVEPFKKGGTEERSSTAFFYCLIKLVAARPNGPSSTKV